MTNNIIRKNPETMPLPVGEYSHVTVIPPQATWYTFSGQIGSDLNNQLPLAFNQQVTNTLKNIQLALASEKLTGEDVIKVNVWSVEEIDWEYFYQKWHELFPKEQPSMTIGYLKALGLPEIKIEIEVIAAKVQ